MSRQKTKYEAYKLLRRIENRFCGDCGDTLLAENAYAMFTPRLWVCSSCTVIHRRVIPKDFTIYKSLNDDWEDSDIEVMSISGGNVKSNETWERYLPSSKILPKPTSFSADKDRETWSKAKYFLKLFLIPQKSDKFLGFKTVDELNISVGDEIISQKIDFLPTRIVDFYLVISYGKFNSYSAKSSSFSAEDIRFSPSVLSTYPDPHAYSDMKIPDMLSPLVFPSGFYLSSKERPPELFSIVLTDTSRVKVYCVVLLIHEILDPRLVEDIIATINNSRQINQVIQPNSSIYSPKAIVLLSHYPFYHLFSVALKQFYRISLSSSPIPLERFIVNFMNDIPLPPQGKIEIVATIADVVLQIRRPAPNQLPMVDFSYRPLFTLLSVDTILILFRCLLCEYSLCFYSSRVALLTPIQEAMLSLLYPFVWQGIYIPVLEQTVLDVIDAPVPYVVGTLRSLLDSFRKGNNDIGESTTVFVDIDMDYLSFDYIPIEKRNDFNASPTNQSKQRPSSGIGANQQLSAKFLNDLNQRMPALPNHDANKLRKKLDENGGIIFKTADILRTCNLAFPNNEHLIPIEKDSFIDRGVAKRRVSDGTQGSPLKSPRSRPQGQPRERKYPTFSTLADYQFITNKLPTEKSIFDPQNNYDQGDGFDAREIRASFLRFFVAILNDYHDIIQSESKNNLHFTEAIVKTLGKQSNGNDSASLASYEPDLANKENDYFVKCMMRSQMFMTFKEEKQLNPNQSEIMFFDESIIDKRNRSLHVFSRRLPTPFLDDHSYDFTESYTCPAPSIWGIDSNKTFLYHQYPLIQVECIGNIQPVKILVKQADIRRIDLPNNQSKSVLVAIQQKYQTNRSSLPNSTSLSSSNQSQSSFDLDEWLISIYCRCKRINHVIITFQCKYKYRRHLQWKLRRRLSSIIIQCAWRKYFALKSLRQLQTLKALEKKIRLVILVQSFIRCIIQRNRYLKILQLTLFIQSLVRMQRNRRAYRITQRKCIKVQSYIRRYLIQLHQYKNLSITLHTYRYLLLGLWKWDHSSLYHRSLCWKLLNLSSSLTKIKYFDLALCREEIERLYHVLDLCHHKTLTFTDSMSFEQKHELIMNRNVFYDLYTSSYAKTRSTTSKPNPRELFTTKESRSIDVSLSSSAQSHIKKNLINEDKERKAIYLYLKNQTTESVKQSIYQSYELENDKKRKQTLSQSVWMSYDEDMNDSKVLTKISTSMNVCLLVNSIHETKDSESLESKDVHVYDSIEIMKQRRIHKHVLEVARIGLCRK